MTSRITINNCIIYLVLIAFAAGCTTMRSLPATNAQSLANQIEVGDKIKITRNDLTEVTLEVGGISDEGISGGGVFVAYSEIQQVQLSEFSTGKTVGLIAAILAVVAAVASTADYGPVQLNLQ